MPTMVSNADPTLWSLSGPYYVLFAIGLWRMLTKAGIPGWGAIIPIYNVYLYIKLGGLSGVMLFVLLIPIVNIFAALYIGGRLAAAYGHGWLMAVFGLFFLLPLGVLVLGFDRSTYRLPRYDTVGPSSEALRS
jgi:hypothetical protein